MTTVVVIGAGPRGTTVLERLVAHARMMPRPQTPVQVHLVDPFPPGPGRVWRTDQSAELLMNTVLEEQTVFPDESVAVHPRQTGPTMAQWAAGVLAGEIPAADEARADLRALPSPGFPPRRLYGHYLAWAFERIVQDAPDWMAVTVHRAEALEVLDAPDTRAEHPLATTAPGAGPDPAAGQVQDQLVRLDDGTDLLADHVVLCLGHVPARPAQNRQDLAAYAGRGGLAYQPPALPAEVDLGRTAPPGAEVIVRGFGLNFFDLMALATTGRGGRFTRSTGGGLVYRPSGREPVFWVTSRRGVPYRAKPVVDGRPLPQATLRWTTVQRFRDLAAHLRRDQEAALGAPAGGPAAPPAEAEGLSGTLGFNRDVWPYVLADARLAYYGALARVRPQAIEGDPESFLSRIVPERHAAFAELEARFVPDPAERLDLDSLISPLKDRHFGSPEELEAWMRGFLERDIAAARAGADSPLKMVQVALTAARLVVKELVAAGLIEETSFADELRGWFEDFVAGLCDGPPVERIEQALALHRAGFLRFAGPAAVTGDVGTATPAFSLRRLLVDAEPVRTTHLIEAASPANRVMLAEDRLLRSMLDAGRVRARESQLANGRLYRASGLEVAGPAHRTVNAAGEVHPGRYALGLQLSAVQWGLAIAAQPGTNAPSLRDADAIARAVLGLAAEPRAAGSRPVESRTRIP